MYSTVGRFYSIINIAILMYFFPLRNLTGQAGISSTKTNLKAKKCSRISNTCKTYPLGYTF